MFRTVFPSIIRSSRLHIQQQAYVKQLLLAAAVWQPAGLKTSKMHLFFKLFILGKHSTCFGWSFRPSSGPQDFTYSNTHTSNSCY